MNSIRKRKEMENHFSLLYSVRKQNGAVNKTTPFHLHECKNVKLRCKKLSWGIFFVEVPLKSTAFIMLLYEKN